MAKVFTSSRAGGKMRVDRGLQFLLSVALIGGLWVVAYRFTAYLPPASEVLSRGWLLLQERATYVDVAASAKRLAIGLTIGFLAALAVTVSMRTSSWLERFFYVYVFTAASLPSLAVALFSLMALGRSEFGVYLAVAIVIFPYVVFNLREGMNALDERLQQMAKVYGFGRWRTLRHITLPEVAPDLFGALRSSYALGWKLVVVTEVFTQSTGIGYRFKEAQDFFRLVDLVTWLVFFFIVVFAMEYGVLQPLERVAFRWRSVERT